MSDTASAQLKRLLHLIPRVADGEEHTIAEIAGAVRMSPSELLHDLGAISERFDAPGGFVEGVSILIEQDTVCVNASHFHRPMRLTMPELCAHLFKDYQFGLSLVQKNTRQSSFVLTREAVDAPEKFLSDLVVRSHYPLAPAQKD